MEGERSSLLRRSTPLLAVMALVAPTPAGASSFTPDPPPGAATLKPDAAPAAAPAVPVVRRQHATVSHTTVPVARTVVVRTSAPVPRAVVRPTFVKHATAKHATPPRPMAKPRQKPKPAAKPTPRLVLPTLPPVLVPRFVEAPLGSDPPRALAALALALAALTALSGAGVVFSWSKR